MKKALTILSVFLLIGTLVGGIYAYFVYSVYNLSQQQKIAENTQITSEWLEIKLDKPLKTNRQIQKIMLSVKDYEKKIGEGNLREIELKDGTIINPEIEIIDENGKPYHLKSSSRLQSSELGMLIGFSLDGEKHKIRSLPKNVNYKTIRIRSDKPFQCEKIIWYDHDLK